MRAAWFLGLLAGCSAQSAESWSLSDTNEIEALRTACPTETGTPPTAPNVNVLLQVDGTHVNVASAPGNPDAMWLTDEYDTVLAFKANPTFPENNVAISTTASDIKLYLHYPSCHITSTPTSMQTYRAKYDNWVTGDGNSFSSDVQDTSPFKPRFTINYAAKTASIKFDQLGGVNVPAVYVKDSSGTVLHFDTQYATGAPGGDTERTLPTITFAASATYLTACTLTCATEDLSSMITASLETSASNGAFGTLSAPSQCTAVKSCTLPTTFTPRGASETVTVSATKACIDSGTGYSLFAKYGAATLAYGPSTAVSFATQPAWTDVTVKLQCGTTYSEMSLDLVKLRVEAAYLQAAQTLGPVAQSAPVVCTYGGINYGPNDVWTAGELSCTCVNCATECKSECGSSKLREDGVYFDGAEVAGMTIACVIIALVIVGGVYFYRMQQKAREAVEGRHRSFSGQSYYGKGPGGQEGIELPPPSSIATESNNV